MWTYRAPCATDRLDNNGNRFTKEAIKDIALQQPKVPVTVNFGKNQIGSTENFFIREDGVLIVEFDVRIPDLHRLDCFAVLGGTTKIQDLKRDDNGAQVISRFTVEELSIVTFPADPSLTAIQSDREDVDEEA